jgi:hypothetical protein
LDLETCQLRDIKHSLIHIPLADFEIALPSCDFGRAELTNADRELITTSEELAGIALAVGREMRATK